MSHLLRSLVVCASLLPVLLCAGLKAASAPIPMYQQATAPVDLRVEDLLSRMTPEEKIAQLSGLWEHMPSPGAVSGELGARLRNGVGTFTFRKKWQLGLEEELVIRNEIRRFLREHTRLGIPAFFHEEAAHGYMKTEATSFPAPIGLACTWDEPLIEQAYDVAAREARSRGANQILAPVVDLMLDPRWGRADETLGEDPYLNGRLGAAIVRGLQGSASGAIDQQHVMATLKHLTGHGAPEGGLNQSPAHVGPRELRDSHLLPFAYIIREARPSSIMPSYNTVDGIPSHANAELLLDIVRGEYGFKGLFVSDYNGVIQLFEKHHLVGSKVEAARLALASGVQMELPLPDTFSSLIPLLGTDSEITNSVDKAVRAVLQLKFRMGLFDEEIDLDPVAARRIEEKHTSSELALQVARESIVLLKNAGQVLPILPGRYKRIAVIGPNADVARLGGYSGTPIRSITTLAGLRELGGPGIEFAYAQGCQITGNDPKQSFWSWYQEHPTLPDSSLDDRLMGEAVEVAAHSDLVILVLGENEAISREATSQSKLGDRPSLDLFGAQSELAHRILDVGKPVVLVLFNGRPLCLHDIGERASAIIEGWYAGQEGGRAMAEILLGRTVPSGKLTCSFPRSVGHLPAQYRRLPSSAEYSYLFDDHRALYPFGFGLSYTSFEYSQPALSNEAIKNGDGVEVTVDVRNTGACAGTEIVQLYLRDEVSSVERPLLELREFRRIQLKPGETSTVRFRLMPEAFSFCNREFRRVVEPGWFTVMVGGSSEQTKSVRLLVE